jgi:hypothetical protein
MGAGEGQDVRFVESFPEELFISVEHYHDGETDDPVFFLEAKEDPKVFARVDQDKYVAVYRLVKTVTVRAEIKVLDAS